jgi:membrane fusion protein (multidrug efflux system)
MNSLIKSGLLASLMIGALSCSQPADKNTTAASQEVTDIPVRTEKIAKQTLTRTLEYTANLIPFQEVHYAPASPGRIDKITVDVGSRVRKGQILVEIDKTQLIQAETQLASATDSYRRIDTLYKLGSIAEQQYEQAKTQYDLAKQNVEYLAKNTTLKSPIDGIVTGKYFEAGELYSGAPNTSVGKSAILSLMQIDPLKAVVSISQAYYEMVKPGMLATITADILKDQSFEGRILKVYPTIDQATRTFKTEILVKNPGELLRPGMFTAIEIQLGEGEGLLVPAISVLKQSGTNIRYLFINDNGTARRIDVKIGDRVNDKLEVISDELKEGMDLVVDGQARLLQGSKIHVISNQ